MLFRSCGESLRVECPACAQTMRTGLKHCDQCSANVKVVGAAKAQLVTAVALVEQGQLQEVEQQLSLLRKSLEHVRLGGSAGLSDEINMCLNQVGERLRQARQFLRAAEDLEGRPNFGRQLERCDPIPHDERSPAVGCFSVSQEESSGPTWSDNACRLWLFWAPPFSTGLAAEPGPPG